MSTAGHCCHAQKQPDDRIPPLNRRLGVMGSVFIAVFLLSFLPYFESLNDSLLTYVGIVWWAVLIGQGSKLGVTIRRRFSLPAGSS